METISKLIINKKLKNEIRINGFKRVNELYNWDNIAKKYTLIYRKNKPDLN